MNIERMSKVGKWLIEGEQYIQHEGPLSARVWKQGVYLTFQIHDRETNLIIREKCLDYSEEMFTYRFNNAMRKLNAAIQNDDHV